MPVEDYYKTLGVPKNASDDAIKRAYRKLARKYHPDVNTDTDAAAMFQAVGDAYDVLRDPEKRAAYDQYGADWQNPRPERDWSGGFGFAPEDMARGDGADFREFFEAFRPDAFAQRSVQHVRLELELADLFTDAPKTLQIVLPKMDQQGRVSWEEKQLAVRLPKGVSEGQHIRLQTQGVDLVAEVVLKPHPVFRVHGRDLAMDLPVTPWEAALGASVTMPTPAGDVQIKVPANARTGQKLRLKGRGLPGPKPGDLYAEILIVNPPVKTEEARALYQDMARKLAFDPRRDKGR